MCWPQSQPPLINTENYRKQNGKYRKLSKFVSRNRDTAPRNVQQVYNRKKGLRSTKGSSAKANLTDEVQVVLSLVQEQNNVKAAFLDSDKPMCVILCDDWQIIDLKRFCTSMHQSVLGIDRTFNLGKCFVTVTTYKYTDAVHNHTSEPVFLGPTYLHWNATVSTYANFLNHLHVKLACDLDI